MKKTEEKTSVYNRFSKIRLQTLTPKDIFFQKVSDLCTVRKLFKCFAFKNIKFVFVSPDKDIYLVESGTEQDFTVFEVSSVRKLNK